ncbi:hypothetical protein BLS_009471 [Venturia inaequalis]|uniref:Uncharacterized protein n=1 Tax=Venturia inaequalis TaxID=5025 RepID=A0A8H3V3R4_VENIN|nr:hypothetical protein BLS_009471 [Venturia inaequalis]
MPRKSKAQAAATATKSSTKRQTPPPTTTTLAKRPKRQSASQAAPTKSDYFSNESSQSEEKDDDSIVESPGVESSDLDSLPDDEELQVESSFSEGEEGFDEKPKRSHNSASAKKNTTKSGGKAGGKGISSTKSELWRPGVSTGLEAGTQVVIKKPKARDAGETPYTDDTIHPNTLLFLEDLAANNDRGWLKMHDPDYRTSQKDFNSFLEALTQNVVEADDTVPELPVKDIIKPNGGSCVAGGLWMPEANAIALLRRDIDRRPQRIKAALKNAGIRREFLEGVPDNDAKVVKKFVAQSSQSALKTKPKGFDADHKDIDLLRLKSFTLTRNLDDKEVLGQQGLARISELIATLVPFITYLNSVVMPDDEDEDEVDDNTDEEEGSVEVDD